MSLISKATLEFYLHKISKNLTSSFILVVQISILLWVFWLCIINNSDELILDYLKVYFLWIVVVLLEIINNHRKIFSEKASTKHSQNKTDDLSSEVGTIENTIPEIIALAVISIPVLLIIAILIYSGEFSKTYTFTERGNSINYYSNILLACHFLIDNFKKLFDIQHQTWIRILNFISFICLIIGISSLFFASRDIVEVNM